jgi:hypothetical protein
MKIKFPALTVLLATSYASVLFCVPQAAATTYNVNATGGSATIVGTITTDGTLGVLSIGNLTDWNLVIDFGGGFIAPLTGPLSGNNSGVVLTGILSATSRQLLFDFGNTDPNASEFEIAQLATLPLYGVLWSADNGTRLATSIDLAFIPTRDGNDEVDNITSLGPTVLPIAESETPLPAALPLFVTGLGALGLVGRLRKKKT